ncbi:MAG: hypothetical protein AAFY71_06880 [Bacteroidota bacterium]
MSDLPTEYKRIKRLVKSLIPRMNRKAGRRNYKLEDARHMINELGMQMPAELLSYLIEDNKVLDDFATSVQALEDELDMEVVDQFSSFFPDLEPKVYIERSENVVGFTINTGGEEIIFAEYPLPPAF